MKFKLIDKKIEYDIELVVLKSLKHLDKKTKKYLKKVQFEAKEGQSQLLGNILYVGTNKIKGEDLKIAFSNAIKQIKKTKFSKVKIPLVVDKTEYCLDELVEGLVLGSYSFNKYKTEAKENLFDVFIDISDSKVEKTELEKILEKRLEICKSVNLVRDIVNTPPEDYFPKKMAEQAKEIAKENNLECKVFGEDYLKKNGMNAMLAVGRASRHESQLIHLTYKPKKPKGKVVLVGKGLTYDSGGLSLKSGAGMVSMKCDKSGGSAVLGIMNTLNAISCEYEVHGIIGAVENMIGGDAYKPDDVLKAKNGVTIEVTNTDAEGRLVLADCLCYAQDEIKDIDYMFDFATLTGACIVALGEYTSAIIGHNQKLRKKIEKASFSSGELVAHLPFNRYLPSFLQSGIADTVNSPSNKAGGSITAGLFLDKFIEAKNKKKWFHFDIAGPAYRQKEWGYNPYGGTGASVRLILDFFKVIK